MQRARTSRTCANRYVSLISLSSGPVGHSSSRAHPQFEHQILQRVRQLDGSPHRGATCTDTQPANLSCVKANHINEESRIEEVWPLGSATSVLCMRDDIREELRGVVVPCGSLDDVEDDKEIRRLEHSVPAEPREERVMRARWGDLMMTYAWHAPLTLISSRCPGDSLITKLTYSVTTHHGRRCKPAQHPPPSRLPRGGAPALCAISH